MKASRLYDRPEHFSEMVARQLEESMGVRVEMQVDEPLLLNIRLGEDEKVQVSLHQTYGTYMASGDLNAAIDYMNGIVRNLQWTHMKKDEILKLDPAYIYPAIRDERYVLEAGKDSSIVSDPYLPGLRVIYLEIKDQCTKIINEAVLEYNPQLSEEKVKRLALRNLRSAGWQDPSLILQSPSRPSCTVEVFTDPPHPIDCQFLIPEMTMTHLPSQFVIAFTNRQYTVLMRLSELMNSKEQAIRLMKEAKFEEVVKRSFHLMPHSVSRQIYWVCNGKVEPLT